LIDANESKNRQKTKKNAGDLETLADAPTLTSIKCPKRGNSELS
jgi:hypothetical protein